VTYPTLPGVPRFDVEVLSVTELTPRMRRISLSGPELEDFDYLPGQDMMLLLPDGERTVARRYSIRRLDRTARRLDIDVVLHGNGPGMRWASTARPGQRIEVMGPRGKISLNPSADWHLFAGDETALPGQSAMLEALPDGVPAMAFFELDDHLELEVRPGQQVHWFQRGGPNQLADAITSAELPAGHGQAYIAGELGLVASVQQALLAHGLGADQISAKPYWRRDRPNADRGEPDR
jgi:NADPH-dependent ferric siderophore reductase